MSAATTTAVDPRPVPERRLIDWHTHVWQADQLGDWDHYLPRAVDSGTPELHAEAMRAGEVSEAIVIGLTSRHLGLDISNDYIAAYIDQCDGAALGVASVDPNDPAALEELERAATELKLSGLKLSPPYQAFHPHSDEAWRIYELADRLGMFIIFHQGWVFHPACSLRAASPIYLDDVARALPDMKIVIAHMGQPWISETVAVMSRNRNVFTDISARLHRPWQLYNGLMSLLDYGVIDRVVFGTDFPIATPRDGVALLRGLNDRLNGMPPIDEAIIDSILYERPLSMLTHARRGSLIGRSADGINDRATKSGFPSDIGALQSNERR